MILQEASGFLMIQTETDFFQCLSSEFVAMEPDYVPVPSDAVRIWRESFQCLQARGNQAGDPFYTHDRLARYCANIAAYQAAYADFHAAPALWIHYDYLPQSETIIMQADGVPLMRNISDDVLRIIATIRVAADPDAAIVEQITQSFPIRMCYRDGSEAFIRLVAPVAPGTFQIDLSFENERPVRYQLFDKDFMPIEIDGATFACQQVTPLIIDVYKP